MTEHKNNVLGSRHTSPVPSGDSPPEQEAPSSLPPTPPSPSLDANDIDSKISRKREREVSLEPATPQATAIEIDPARGENKERRTPAKKNRVSATLDSTQEEDVDSDDAASVISPALSCSPPTETKIRQISRGVEDITWKNAQKDALSEGDHDMIEPASKLSKPEQVEGQEPVLEDGSATEAVPPSPKGNPPLAIDDAVEDQHTVAADIAEKPEKMDDSTSQVEDVKDDVETSSEALPTNVPLPRSRHDSDSDADGEKGLKRKLGDRTVSESLAPGGTKFARNGVVAPAAVKRPRDDPDADVNPRETKRPTPPPEEEKKAEEAKRLSSGSPPASTVASTPTIASGFMRYASTSSPFASVTGPSVFGSKPSTTSPWASASSSAHPSPSLTSSPFSSTLSAAASTTATPLKDGTHKRTGFEAFASMASPFASAAKRPKSPSTPGVLGRSRSPSRGTPVRTTSAFSAYAAGGAQGFAAPTPRRAGTPALGDIASGSRSGSVGLGILDGRSKEEDGEEGGVTFGERLRAEKDKESEETSDEEPRVTLTEKDVVTGEEDETLVWQARGKLYALSDQNTWKERGTGLLKLNVRRKDGEGARLVMRKDAVYTVLLNAPLFKGMKCTFAQDPRYIRFSVFENGATTHYNFRVGSADQAKGLLDAINAHIPV